MKVYDFLPELIDALRIQLESDDKRWGDVWLERTHEGQEFRIFVESYQERYYKDFVERGIPIPWLKVIGEAFIGWIRDTHPEYWED